MCTAVHVQGSGGAKEQKIAKLSCDASLDLRVLFAQLFEAVLKMPN